LLEELLWALECQEKLLQSNKLEVTMKSSAINKYGYRLLSEQLEVLLLADLQQEEVRLQQALQPLQED
jgi:hypothetical protein